MTYRTTKTTVTLRLLLNLPPPPIWMSEDDLGCHVPDVTPRRPEPAYEFPNAHTATPLLFNTEKLGQSEENKVGVTLRTRHPAPGSNSSRASPTTPSTLASPSAHRARSASTWRQLHRYVRAVLFRGSWASPVTVLLAGYLVPYPCNNCGGQAALNSLRCTRDAE